MDNPKYEFNVGMTQSGANTVLIDSEEPHHVMLRRVSYTPTITSTAPFLGVQFLGRIPGELGDALMTGAANARLLHMGFTEESAMIILPPFPSEIDGVFEEFVFERHAPRVDGTIASVSLPTVGEPHKPFLYIHENRATILLLETVQTDELNSLYELYELHLQFE